MATRAPPIIGKADTIPGSIIISGPKAATKSPTLTILPCVFSLNALKSVAKSLINVAAWAINGINTSPKAIPAPSMALVISLIPPLLVSFIISAIDCAAPSASSNSPVKVFS